MAVNRYKDHLVVFLEDRPYREIMNGVKNCLKINANVLDVKPPVGGWTKVFETLEENKRLLEANQHMHVLLLMDFDNDHAGRKQKLDGLMEGFACRERVFMLGIDGSESEDLKKALAKTNYEAIAGLLLVECPDNINPEWQSKHLRCNYAELKRMRDKQIFAWLFL